MRLFTVLSFILFSFYASTSWSCAGYPNGITSESLSEAMTNIEQKLSENSQLQGQSNIRYLWEDIQTSAGLEGDCSAITINAKVNISTRDKENVFCVHNTEVNYVASSVDFLSNFEAQFLQTGCIR